MRCFQCEKILVNARYDKIKDIIAVNDLAIKYFKNDMFSSPKTALLWENTQSPEKPMAKDIIDNFNASGIALDTLCLIPLVISRRQRINEQFVPLKSIITNSEITEKIIM